MSKDIEKRITDLENRFTALEKELRSGSASSKTERRQNPSVKDFLLEKNPTTAIDSVLAIAVYHERFMGVSSFSANDISDLIRKAKLTKPKNINDLINKNKEKGYFEEDEVGDDGKKRWYVTNLGTSLVDNNFNSNEQNT